MIRMIAENLKEILWERLFRLIRDNGPIRDDDQEFIAGIIEAFTDEHPEISSEEDIEELYELILDFSDAISSENEVDD
jgi:hypothetical protein